MPIPNSRLVGGVRSWPGVAVGRPSPYALPGSASVVGPLPSVLGSTSPWTWRRVHAAACSFTAASGSSRARPVPARGFLRPIHVPGFLYGVLLLDKNPNPSERQPPSRRERRRYRLAAGIMPSRGLRSARQGRTRVRRQPLASCRRDTLRSPRLRACAASSEMRWRRSTTCGRERRNTARASYRSPYSEDSMRLARGRPTPTGSNPLSPPSPPYRDEGGARADAAGEGWTSGPLSHAERAPAVPTPHATQTSGLPRRMWADPNRI